MKENTYYTSQFTFNTKERSFDGNASDLGIVINPSNSYDSYPKTLDLVDDSNGNTATYRISCENLNMKMVSQYMKYLSKDITASVCIFNK